MIDRYQSAFMKQWWSEANKYRTWFRVEVAYLDAYLAPKGSANDVASLKAMADKIDWEEFAAQVEVYDAQVKHDVIAFLHVLEDQAGPAARLIHVGLTSSDVVDTSLALLLHGAALEITKKLDNLIQVLWQKAERYRGVGVLGRTHGQGAEATTFGIKLLGHLCEFARGRERLKQATAAISVGKFSGAVGVYAHTSPDIELRALKSLGLEPETIATQVVARDRHAAFFSALATLAGSVERLAVEIRLLMHGQVREAFEPFSSKQKGSSAMPHKKNPVLSENLTGLMRMVRSYALAALENQSLWHERDISHSSVERIIGPDATSLMDFALTRLSEVMDGLVVDEKRLAENLEKAGDRLYSQGVMLGLVKKGMMRQEAYELVQKAALNPSGSLRANLSELQINNYLNSDELDEIFSWKNSVKFEDDLFARVKSFVDIEKTA